MKQCGNVIVKIDDDEIENLDLDNHAYKLKKIEKNNSTIENEDPFFGTDKCDPITTEVNNNNQN